jgi:hypothetical protein
MLTIAEGIPSSDARTMNRYPEYTCRDDPRTRRQSLDCNCENTNSTLDFGTLSPKKTMFGLKNPSTSSRHCWQCGTRKVSINSLKKTK